MTTKRARRAWLLLLILTLMLGLVCVASIHAHNCDNGEFCPICQFLNESLKFVAVALLLVLAVWIAFYRRTILFTPVAFSFNLIDSKIRMND